MPVQERCQHDGRRRLGDPIANGGNGQGTGLASAFVNVDSQERLGLVRSISETGGQCGECAMERRRQILDPDPIHTGSTRIVLDLVEGHEERRHRAELIEQSAHDDTQMRLGQVPSTLLLTHRPKRGTDRSYRTQSPDRVLPSRRTGI